MPLYNSHLLPNQNYCFVKHILSDKYLVRHTQSKDFIDLQTNKILIKQICSPVERLEDLSTNLLANFTIEDLTFEIINDGGNKDYFTRYWSEGELINKIPLFEKDFRINHERGFFFLPIKDIHELSVPYSIGTGSDNFKAICKVIHTPTNSNFWHFSLRWYNEKGEDLRDIKGNFKNRLFTTSRSLILEMAEFDIIPQYEPLPEIMYLKK